VLLAAEKRFFEVRWADLSKGSSEKLAASSDGLATLGVTRVAYSRVVMRAERMRGSRRLHNGGLHKPSQPRADSAPIACGPLTGGRGADHDAVRGIMMPRNKAPSVLCVLLASLVLQGAAVNLADHPDYTVCLEEPFFCTSLCAAPLPPSLSPSLGRCCGCQSLRWGLC